jgi:hypothetical protein
VKDAVEGLGTIALVGIIAGAAVCCLLCICGIVLIVLALKKRANRDPFDAPASNIDYGSSIHLVCFSRCCCCCCCLLCIDLIACRCLATGGFGQLS